MNTLRLGLVILCWLPLLTAASVKGDEHLNPVPAHKAEVREKLYTIFVSIDLRNASMKQAIDSLAEFSKEADSDHHGIAFYLDPSVAELAKPITLKLDHVPVGVALHYVCELAGLRSEINDRFVKIRAFTIGLQDFQRETFHVDPSFVENQHVVVPSSALLPR